MMAQAFVAASRTADAASCRRARCRRTSSPAATRRRISSSTSSGCATSAASPTAASTSCRTASCWPRRWSPTCRRRPRARARHRPPRRARPVVAAARSTICCVGYEETVPQFVERAAADRMALHQRPGLGDARQGRAARPQPGVDEGRRADARRSGAARRRAGVLVGHHGARLDHHHPRPVVGLRPHLRGDDQPLGVVPPAGPVRRMGAVLDDRRRWPPTRAAWAPGTSSTNPGRLWLPWCRKASSSTSRVQSDEGSNGASGPRACRRPRRLAGRPLDQRAGGAQPVRHGCSVLHKDFGLVD